MSYDLDWLENEESKEKSLPEKKISKPRKIEITTLLESEKEVNWDNLNISQDDLWFLYRLKFGKGTRDKRSVLLPKFTKVFNF